MDAWVLSSFRRYVRKLPDVLFTPPYSEAPIVPEVRIIPHLLRDCLEELHVLLVDMYPTSFEPRYCRRVQR